ncbi:TetR/AcrR family transcriptional regulator [Actinoplanes sp. M2I2]|uniref:TetR/AcrR family transcriptional regulator n=1 Tax=Actinoplanes sp. M2I2 TaxID=1734444 RepID=UPI002020CC60|nr:TetR/AcrR family transcriptional regulator [Actinoplanes sp. M2I2]
MRADAERSTARILEAAETVLADNPNASLERIGDVAGVARATVHRRFASRQALLDALSERLNDRYLLVMEQAKVETAPPVIALHRASEIVFDLKISYRFSITLASAPSREVQDGLELLFTRLQAEGAIAVASPSWCRRVYLALMGEVYLLPDDAPELADAGGRAGLLVKTVLGALGGR